MWIFIQYFFLFCFYLSLFGGSIFCALYGVAEPRSWDEKIQISKDRNEYLMWNEGKTMYIKILFIFRVRNRLPFTLKAHRLRVDVYPSSNAYFYGRDVATKVTVENFRLGALEARPMTVVGRVEATYKTSVITDVLRNIHTSCYEKTNTKFTLYLDFRIQPFLLDIFLPPIIFPVSMDCPRMFQTLNTDMIKDLIDVSGKAMSLVVVKRGLNLLGDRLNKELLLH